MTIGEILLALYLLYLGFVLYGKDKRIKDLEEDRRVYYNAWINLLHRHGKG